MLHLHFIILIVFSSNVLVNGMHQRENLNYPNHIHHTIQAQSNENRKFLNSNREDENEIVPIKKMNENAEKLHYRLHDGSIPIGQQVKMMINHGEQNVPLNGIEMDEILPTHHIHKVKVNKFEHNIETPVAAKTTNRHQNHQQHHHHHYHQHRHSISVRDVPDAGIEASKIETEKKDPITIYTEGGPVKNVTTKINVEQNNPDNGPKVIQHQNNNTQTGINIEPKFEKTVAQNTLPNITIIANGNQTNTNLNKPSAPNSTPILITGTTTTTTTTTTKTTNATSTPIVVVVPPSNPIPVISPQKINNSTITPPRPTNATTTTTTTKLSTTVATSRLPTISTTTTTTTTTPPTSSTTKTTKKPLSTTTKAAKSSTELNHNNNNNNKDSNSEPLVYQKPKITFSADDNSDLLNIPHKQIHHIKNAQHHDHRTNNNDNNYNNKNINHGQLSTELLLDGTGGTNKRQYIIPIVTIIFALPILLGLLNIAVRRIRSYWYTRHYRRMDFLVDGMYNC